MSSNVIRDPGKFEGEPEYALVLYDLVMEGFSDETIFDEDETPIDVFFVDDDLRQKCPGIDKDTFAVILWESTQGFVNTEELSEEQYEKLIEGTEASGFPDEE